MDLFGINTMIRRQGAYAIMHITKDSDYVSKNSIDLSTNNL